VSCSTNLPKMKHVSNYRRVHAVNGGVSAIRPTPTRSFLLRRSVVTISIRSGCDVVRKKHVVTSSSRSHVRSFCVSPMVLRARNAKRAVRDPKAGRSDRTSVLVTNRVYKNAPIESSSSVK